MSLQGLPGISRTTELLVQEVRGFTRDHPELNRLLRGVESSDRQIAWAVMDALSDFNGTPPFSYMTVDQVVAQQLTALLTRMAVISLLESVGLLQTRNHLNYSTGGTSVGVNDKSPLIMKWLQYFKATTEQKLLRAKVAINIESALDFGGVHSELWSVNSTYAAY